MQVDQYIGGNLRVVFHQLVEGLGWHAAIVHQAVVFFEGFLELFALLRRQLCLMGFLDHFFHKRVHIIIAAHFVVPAHIQRPKN